MEKKVSGTICLETPVFDRGRVAEGDRQMVPDTFFSWRIPKGGQSPRRGQSPSERPARWHGLPLRRPTIETFLRETHLRTI